MVGLYGSVIVALLVMQSAVCVPVDESPKSDGNELCSLPPNEKTCEGSQFQYKWRYDTTIGSCFVYESCKEDNSGFEKREYCMKSCQADKAKTICSDPAVTGPCRARFVRYNYDPSTKSCKEFIFGGCGGNDNNFNTEENCLNMCQGE